MEAKPQSLHLKYFIIIPPANFRISPPDLDIDLTKSSIYLLITKAVNSGPSFPTLDKVSVKLVNPDISANITTDLKDYFDGRTDGYST